MLLRLVLNNVKIAAGSGQKAREFSDVIALRVENFETDDLIVVIFVGAERREIGLRDGEDRADPFFRRVDSFNAFEAQ